MSIQLLPIMKYNLLPLAFAFLSTATLALGLFITFYTLHTQSHAVVLHAPPDDGGTNQVNAFH